MPIDSKTASTCTTKAQSNGELIWYNSAELENVTSQHFQADYWLRQDAIIGSAMGRGTTYFFKYNNKEFVLRHYRRGGLIGKLLTDQYLYTGLHNTRAWREMDLLMQMKELGLPAPTPVAARVRKKIFYYQADIITRKIPQAQDVHQYLLQQPISTQVWRKIGATIARFHRNQIFHHDLNIHNIMLDDKQQPWLIDFDKCDMRAGSDWKKDNLARLQRSLNKEKSNSRSYHYTEQNWQSLLEGYTA